MCENELERIAEEQGTNVSTLVDMVKENEKILDTMKVSVHEYILQMISFDCLITTLHSSSFDSMMVHFQYALRENFVSELVKIVMRSDRNNDMKISPKEGQLLAVRLSIEVRIIICL